MRELDFDEIRTVDGGTTAGDISMTLAIGWSSAVTSFAIGSVIGGPLGGAIGGLGGFLVGSAAGIGYTLSGINYTLSQ